jgi:hypothetical protein
VTIGHYLVQLGLYFAIVVTILAAGRAGGGRRGGWLAWSIIIVLTIAYHALGSAPAASRPGRVTSGGIAVGATLACALVVQWGDGQPSWRRAGVWTASVLVGVVAWFMLAFAAHLAA